MNNILFFKLLHFPCIIVYQTNLEVIAAFKPFINFLLASIVTEITRLVSRKKSCQLQIFQQKINKTNNINRYFVIYSKLFNCVVNHATKISLLNIKFREDKLVNF